MRRLQLREIHRNGRLGIHVVEWLQIEGGDSHGLCRVLVQLRPVAIIVRDADEVRVFDLNGRK